MHLKRIAALSFLGLASLAAAAPWMLYALALALIGGRPEAPTVLQAPSVQLRTWQEAKGVGVPQLNLLSPYNYFFVASMSAGDRASTTVAWQVARDFNVRHLRERGTLRWHITGAALTIWLTRNWSMEQLLSRASELHARGAA